MINEKPVTRAWKWFGFTQLPFVQKTGLRFFCFYCWISSSAWAEKFVVQIQENLYIFVSCSHASVQKLWHSTSISAMGLFFAQVEAFQQRVGIPFLSHSYCAYVVTKESFIASRGHGWHNGAMGLNWCWLSWGLGLQWFAKPWGHCFCSSTPWGWTATEEMQESKLPDPMLGTSRSGIPNRLAGVRISMNQQSGGCPPFHWSIIAINSCTVLIRPHISGLATCIFFDMIDMQNYSRTDSRKHAHGTLIFKTAIN